MRNQSLLIAIFACCAVLTPFPVRAQDEHAHDEHAHEQGHEHGADSHADEHKHDEHKHEEHKHDERAHEDKHEHKDEHAQESEHAPEDKHGHDEHGHDEETPGQTTFSPKAMSVAELEILTAGPAEIKNSTRVYGRILADDTRVAHLTPRFPGVVKEIRKVLGDTVQRGETVAVIENNQNLQTYEVKSQIAGVVIRRHATLGESVDAAQEILMVADLSQVWADFQLYGAESERIVAGQRISINLGNNQPAVPGEISYISPITDEATQSKLIRAILPNPDGRLRPGLFVSGVLTSSETTVPVAVKREAVQNSDSGSIVYVNEGSKFKAVPVELGRQDSEHVEISSGLAPGVRYVGKNSFIIKADLEKGSAGHDHAH